MDNGTNALHVPVIDAANAQDFWNRCLDTMQDLPARRWLEETYPVALSEQTITLRAPNGFVKDWLERRHGRRLEDVVSSVAGHALRIEILTAGGHGPAPAVVLDTPPEPDLFPDARDGYESSLTHKYTFETFVIGPSNRFAHAAALAVAEAPATAYNPLFIHGGTGLGKTHLLHAIGNHVKRLYPHKVVKYVSTETFTNHFINAIRHDRTEAFKRHYRENDVLLIDDIQFLENKEGTQEEFFHTFNALHAAAKQIVISSDRPAKSLATLEDRLRSRFEWGLTTDISSPDLETRIAILRMKAGIDHYEVGTDVLTYIASRVESNIRELEGALIRVVAYAALNGRTATQELAEEVLGNLPTPGSEPVRVDVILAETSAYFGITLDEIRSHNRSRSLVQARQIAMYLVRDMTELSLPKIGEAFGGRDHTTVLHAMTKVRRLLSEKRVVYHQVQELTARIRKRTGH